MAVQKKTAEEISKMSEAELDAYERELAAERAAAADAGGEGGGEEEDDDPDGAPGSQKRKGMYARFKQEEQRRKKLEEELAAERARRDADTTKLIEAVVGKGNGGDKDEDPEPAPPAALDVKAERRKYHKLMQEGEFDKAAEVLDKIDDHQAELDRWRANRDAWKDRQTEKRVAAEVAKTAQEVMSKAERARLQQALDEACEEIYEEFPFLDDKAEHRDEDAINAVLARRNVLIAEGLSPVRALKKAAAEKGPRFAKLQPGYEEDEDGRGKKAPAGESRQDRIRRLTEEANRRTPPNPTKGTKGMRDRDGKPDIRKMTDEQLKNLPDEELAKIDGRQRFAAENRD